MAHLAISPAFASNDFECGLNAIRRRQILEALRYFDNAELSGYNANECASSRWHCWMLLGDFEQAWKESDFISLQDAGGSEGLWDGLPFDGNQLIIRCLHGLGDAIQFIRYARLLKRHTARITVETHAALVPLFRKLEYIDDVVTWEDCSSKGQQEWNQQIEVMELPRAFRTTLDTVPMDVPYLNVGIENKERSKRALGNRSGRLRVGLVWASSEWNPARSVSAADLIPILQLTHADFFSFQRGPRSSDLEILHKYRELHNTADHSPGILDTAADMVNMDVVITVDTMAAHLAGALGTKVWLLLPFESDWRWMLNRDSSPWYPTMRIFRQSAPGDWRPVINQVVASLLDQKAAHPASATA